MFEGKLIPINFEEINYNASQSGTSMVIDDSPKPKYKISPIHSKFVKP